MYDRVVSREKPIYALVCAGGGAHGAYQVGVLKYIHEHFSRGQASPFRVFSGTSCGSLNTTFFATRSHDAHDARLELEEMWLDFDVPEYHGNILLNTLGAFVSNLRKPAVLRKSSWSLLDPDHLLDVVDRGFSRPSFDRALAEGTTLGASVSATELRSSRLVFFQEGPAAAPWSLPTTIAVNTHLCAPHVAASCSVPFVFPPVRIRDHYYADGGVANHHPYGVVVNMGATRVLTIATDMPLPDELPEYPPGFRPRVTDAVRMLTTQLGDEYRTAAGWFEIINYFLDHQSLEETQHSIGGFMRQGSIELSKYRPTEIELFTPSRRIRPTDTYQTELFDEKLKGSATALQFRKDFIQPLIEFGYEDAKARHDYLENFFDEDRPRRPSILSAEQPASL